MLLSLMRRHAKSWLIKFLIGIIALVFIFYFGYSFKSNENVKIASVNAEVITRQEYSEAYNGLLRNLQKEYRSVWSDKLIKAFDLENRALEGLIEKRIISQEARRIGLDITDKEIQKEIMANPAFQFRGRFDENRYKALLANNRMKPEDFEETMSQDLLQGKLSQFLLSFLPVSAQDVLENYTYANEQVKLGFVRFSSKDFEDSIKLDQEGMANFFQGEKEAYRIPDKVKISYITIDPEDFKDQISLDEQEIKGYYEDNIDIYQEGKQIKARHILFNLAQDASEEEVKKVKEKALSVLEKARGGEDFSKLAEKHSEGPSKDKGGDLGYFSKGRMVPPFEEAAFNLEKGRISDLVRTSFGFHIIKVEDIKEERTKGLEEVRKDIETMFVGNESMDLANEKGLSLIDQMPYDVDLARHAGSHNAPVGSTGYFSQDEPIQDITGDQKLRQSIFSLEKGDISELVEFDGKFFIIQIVDKKPSYLPEIEEVSDLVKEDYAQHLANIETKAAAEDYLAKLKDGKDWDGIAREKGLKPDTTDLFSRQGMPSKIGYAPGLQEAAFSLSEGRRYPDRVFESADGALVIRWEGEKGIDEKKYQEEKEQYRNSLMMAKQRSIFSGWLEKLKQNADIDRTPFEQYK